MLSFYFQSCDISNVFSISKRRLELYEMVSVSESVVLTNCVSKSRLIVDRDQCNVVVRSRVGNEHNLRRRTVPLLFAPSKHATDKRLRATH